MCGTRWCACSPSLGKRCWSWADGRQRGMLADRDDIFYLQLPELPKLVVGTDLAAVIASRKAEFAHNQTITPPPVVLGEFKPENVTPGLALPADASFHGLPASAGVATGPANVMLPRSRASAFCPAKFSSPPSPIRAGLRTFSLRPASSRTSAEC